MPRTQAAQQFVASDGNGMSDLNLGQSEIDLGTNVRQIVPPVDTLSLRAELESLQRAMATRATIEQAKGMLMERLACTVEEAEALIVLQSQRSNRRLYDIAADYVQIGSATALPVRGLRYLLAAARGVAE